MNKPLRRLVEWIGYLFLDAGVWLIDWSLGVDWLERRSATFRYIKHNQQPTPPTDRNRDRRWN
jgi:hypothetical protein